MKRLFSLLLALALILTCVPAIPLTAQAATTVASGTCGDNLTWTLDDEGTLTISGTGRMTNYASYPVGLEAPWDSQRSSVKKVVIESGVTSIGDCAFRYCNNLTSVTIPDTVTAIYSYAFEACVALPSLTIPKSVNYIAWNAFIGCLGLTTIQVKEGNANYHSSGNCLIETASKRLLKGFYNSQIPADGSVTIIGKYAFADCYELTNINIPNCVTYIDEYAFLYCSSLSSITIPENVTTIVGGAFAGCTALSSVIIPDKVTDIGEFAFEGCTDLTSLTIGRGVTRIEQFAFSGCSSLTSVEVTEGNTVYHSSGNCLVETASKTLLLGCETSQIPEDGSVTSIGVSAFAHCDGLTTITIPDSVTSIGDSAFSYCTGLNEIYFEGGAPAFGSYVFDDVTATAYYYLDETWTEEVRQNYGGTITWVEREIPPTIIASGTCGDNLTWTLDEEGTLTISGTGAMYSYSSSTSGPWNSQKSSVKKVVIESGVTSIGNYAFSSCAGLTSVAIPDGVTSIGSCAFSSCTGLTSITIPNSVCTSIGKWAFYDCTSLTSITIPDSMTSIGEFAFYKCKGLEEINFNATAMKDLSSSNYVFAYAGQNGNGITVNIGANVTRIPTYLFCPYSSSSYTPKITTVNFAEGSVCTSIGKWAFYDCASLTSIEIPDSVTSIGENAFASCTGLTSITIPDRVTSIGPRAFEYCTGLTSVTIGNGVTSIGDFAFRGCSSLTGVTLPNSVTSIGRSAFSACTGLTDLTIGTGVTSIGENAFASCTGLTSITIPGSVTNIDAWAFSSCTGLKEIYFEGNAPTFGSSVFYNVTATAYYYPDETWTEEVRQNYGGTITWVEREIPEVIASGTCGDNLTWTLDEEGTLTISGTGAMYSYSSYSNAPWYNYRSSIKKVIIESGVTSIGPFAFYRCWVMTNITVPDSVTSVGLDTFYGCENLKYNRYRGGDYLGNGDNPYHILIEMSDGGATLHESTRIIGYGAFKECASLRSIELPNNITHINTSAFYYCTGLTTISLSDGLTSIGSGAFNHCTSLTSIVIPNGITYIGSGAFSNCTSLTNVVIFNGVTCIESSTFAQCSSLSSITIPPSVTSMDESAFDGCDALTGVYISDLAAWCKIDFENNKANPLNYAGNLYLNNLLLEEIVIPDEIQVLKDYAFINCTSVKKVTVPNSLISSGKDVFYGCTNLEYNIYSNGKYLGNETNPYVVLVGLVSNYLTSFEIHEDTRVIGGRALEYSKLISLTIPGKVISIGESAFKSCYNLKSVKIGDSVTSIGNYAFSSCTLLKNLEIGKNTTSIGTGAFSGCSGLTEIKLSDKVTYMGADAFKNCTGLKCFDTGNGITVINSSTFWGNTGMTNFTIGENVTTISSYAFYGCENITSITIPDNVTRIKADAFRMCTGLKEIYFDGSAPTFDAYIFGGVTATAYYWPDETWTEDVRKNYGGTITWMERKIPVAVTFKDESGNVISQATYVEGAELVAPTVDEIANGRFEAYIFEGWGTDYTGICQGEAEYTAIGTGYTDLQEALDQDTAENITLVKDVECKYLTVQNGSVLDLNGHTLTTKYFTSFGQVVDGQIGGDAVLKAEKGIHLATANSFLPIYDSTAGGYRFYKYELQNLGFKTVAGDDNILKTGTRLNLANTAGYDVLAATENGALDTVVYLSWGDMPGPMRYTFRPETLRNYASQVAADIAAKGSSSKAITLTLTGLNGLDAGTQLNLQPAVETASGMQGQAENKSWTCG